jgi:putative two-component system response regulator
MTSPDDTACADLSFDTAAAAQMERIVVDLRRMYRERNDALREVTRAHHEALLRLALAADFRDDDTGVHMVRIGYLAEALALAMGQPRAFAQMLRRAAPMHDVGKVGIPDAILKKPGSYTPDERLVMNEHPKMGADILGRSRVPLFQLAAEIAWTHHERWDGAGYPRRLAGEAIPLSGRIVAVVDFFDALTMDRCYRKAFADDLALQMLREQRGLAFDPLVVDTFVNHAAAMVELRERINRQPPSFEELAALE